MGYSVCSSARRAVARSMLLTGVATLCTIASATFARQLATQPSTRPSTPAASTRPASIVADPYVLIISIDGARPDCLLRADMPNVRAMMARGSFTLWAHTTPIAITTPSHVSMLSGVSPERHGILVNDDPPPELKISVPTIFDLAKARGLSTGLAAGKRKFTLFTRTDGVDFASITDEPVTDDAEVGDRATRIIATHRPRVMVVHFGGPDSVGHAIGWGTAQQIAALDRVDVQVGRLLKAYQDAGVGGQTYVILSADHGGTARNHGRDDDRSRYIPWIATGPGLRRDLDLTRLGRSSDVATYDTFATACLILGLPIPEGIDGKPIFSIFEDVELIEEPRISRRRPATSSATPAPTP